MRVRRNLLWIGIAAGLLSVGVAQGAKAATLAFSGELALVISSLDPIALAGSGFATVAGRANDSDHLAELQLPASVFGATGLLVPVTDPVAYPIGGVVATARNDAGSFEESNGSFGGRMSVLGVAKVCLFGPCTASPLANLSVPISVVGQGGTNFATGPVNLTVVGAPWTLQTVAVGSTSSHGFAHGPASVTSSTLNPSGTIRLVTPIFISTNIGASAVIPAFGFLTLHFVPEPGTALLLGAGVIGLIVGGRRAR